MRISTYFSRLISSPEIIYGIDRVKHFHRHFSHGSGKKDFRKRKKTSSGSVKEKKGKEKIKKSKEKETDQKKKEKKRNKSKKREKKKIEERNLLTRLEEIMIRNIGIHQNKQIYFNFLR